MKPQSSKDFAVVADGGACVTYCSSMAGAVRSARGFSADFKSLIIRNAKTHEVLRVIR